MSWVPVAPVTSSLLLLTLAASPAAAGWTSVGTVSPPKREGPAVVFRNDQGILAVTAVARGVVRVRFAAGRSLGRDFSYAVVPQGPPASLGMTTQGDRSTLTTEDLTITVRHSPLRVAVANAAGDVIDEDDAERGMAVAGQGVRVWKRLRDDQQVYGFGEKNGRLDKRGTNRGGSSFAMWNTDTYAYERDTDPIYVSVPFYLAVRKGRAHGIFLDNTYRTTFDVGRESEGLLSFGTEGGGLDYYIIAGPGPKQVIERYSALTGRMPLPPLWSLGYHQCRYSYFPEAKVREIASGLRRRKIPADAVWLDIHYMDGYAPFTWDPERFPDPGRLVRDLRGQGLRLVTIVDPHIKVQPGTVPYDTGLAGNHFVRDGKGGVFEGPVWPAQASKNPAQSVFPDYTRAATRLWWGGLYRPLLDLGVAGIWNDMNEPSVFKTPTGTMPLDNRHDNDGQPTDHRALHNVYGMQMARATYEGLLRLRPNERPFVLSRASFAGGQRYSALWTGDATSDWSALRGSLPMLMNLGLSGFAFVGSDIGGFAHGPSPELFARWLQASAFAPFMRTHADLGTPDKEPWSFGRRIEAISRQTIELRYRLLPYVYNVMKEASDTGVPALRPLFLEFPEDGRFSGRETEFLFGPSLLVAPVLREGVKQREVMLPAGKWTDLSSGVEQAGGRTISVPVTLESLPIFVREGTFLFQHPTVQHTGELARQPLHIDVYPAKGSTGALYEDDGETQAYQRGVYRSRTFRQQRTDAACTIDVSAVKGSFRPQARSLVFRVRTGKSPRGVMLADQRLPRRGRAGGPGWSFAADGWTTVELPDRPEAFRIAIELAPAAP